MLVPGSFFTDLFDPHYFSIGTTRFTTAYLDMVSAFTTTGFVVFEPYRLNETLHLWRECWMVWWSHSLGLSPEVLAPEGLRGDR